MNALRSALLLIVLIAMGVSLTYGAPENSRWEYRFAPGDHLVYTETVDRHVSGEEIDSTSHSTYTSHVIVIGATEGRYLLGFQRVRQSAELTSYREKGKDKLAEQLPKFREQLAKRPLAVSEVNEIDTLGRASHFWAAVRESSSRYLMAVHEIESLPEGQVAPGARWTGSPPLQAEFRFQRLEDLAGERCALMQGAVKNSVELKYWFCPDSGVLRRIEYDGHYTNFGGKVDEQIVFELKERRAKERLLDWVTSADTSQAALRAILMTSSAVDDAVLAQALRSSDTTTQSLALALILRRDLRVKDAAQIEQLSHSPDPQVARIAKRILSRTPVQAATTKFRALDPGTTLRYMTSKEFDGYPYILHVPPDYGGDKPFPLIVLLTGGPGIAMDGANGSEPAIANTGYLVVYPHAAGKMWWEPESTKMFDALLQELSTLLNIKTTYITGFSNGGTGAVYYASKWPTRFMAMVSLMGAGPCLTDLGTLHFDELAALPTLIVHGTKDPIIPYDCSERLYRALRKKHSAELSIELLKDRGHDITVGTDDGMTLSFFDKISGTQ